MTFPVQYKCTAYEDNNFYRFFFYCMQGSHKLLFLNTFKKFPGGVLPYKNLMGMCRWMGSHFHDWSDYNGVAFSIELLE